MFLRFFLIGLLTFANAGSPNDLLSLGYVKNYVSIATTQNWGKMWEVIKLPALNEREVFDNIGFPVLDWGEVLKIIKLPTLNGKEIFDNIGLPLLNLGEVFRNIKLPVLDWQEASGNINRLFNFDTDSVKDSKPQSLKKDKGADFYPFKDESSGYFAVVFWHVDGFGYMRTPAGQRFELELKNIFSKHPRAEMTKFPFFLNPNKTVYKFEVAVADLKLVLIDFLHWIIDKNKNVPANILNDFNGVFKFFSKPGFDVSTP